MPCVKRYKKEEKGWIKLFFRKTERKKHSVCAILTVGALATIGAITVMKNGKQILKTAGCKIKGMLGKGDCCSSPMSQ